MKPFAINSASVESNSASVARMRRVVPQGGPAAAKWLVRYHDTGKRLQAALTDSQSQRAAGPRITARRRLFGLILEANGYDPDYNHDVETFAPCGLILGGKLLWLNPPNDGDCLLNAQLTELAAA